MTNTLKNFIRHMMFIHTDEMESYEATDDDVANCLPTIIGNIHEDIEEGIETPQTAFFHAYVFALQLNGRYDGYDIVEDKREIESLYELQPDEREEILTTLDEALILYREALTYDAGIQESWSKTWSKLKEKLVDTKKLHAENNKLIFK